MPNYCTNNLTVTGDAKEIKRFHEAITAGELQAHENFRILDNLFPTPKELKDTIKGYYGEGTEEQIKQEEMNKANLKKFGSPDWYEWNCKNYGSKWSDFDGVFGQVSDNETNMTFMSAWSPIGEGIRNVSKQFPTLDFILSYDEGGMAFCGGYAFRNGEIFADIEGEYPSMTKEQSENEEYDEFYEQVSQVTLEIENQCKEALGVSV
jgi:hypothetical protein